VRAEEIVEIVHVSSVRLETIAPPRSHVRRKSLHARRFRGLFRDSPGERPCAHARDPERGADAAARHAAKIVRSVASCVAWL
jgi:hypothetical protein